MSKVIDIRSKMNDRLLSNAQELEKNKQIAAGILSLKKETDKLRLEKRRSEIRSIVICAIICITAIIATIYGMVSSQMPTPPWIPISSLIAGLGIYAIGIKLSCLHEAGNGRAPEWPILSLNQSQKAFNQSKEFDLEHMAQTGEARAISDAHPSHLRIVR